MTIRPAREQDWAAISALLTARALPLDGAREHLPYFLVADDEGTLVGVGGLEVYGEAALLRSLAVATAGGGLGTAIVERLLSRADQLGVREVVLLTTTAASFFPRFGFTPLSRDAVPDAVRRSREFQGACPDSAHVLHVRRVIAN